ncbi:MAG: hypothetical protein ACYC8V_06765, partial [Caulobacteraceae bacterium]
ADFGTIDPTGLTDSTAAFQAALSSGTSFTIPPGVFSINMNLTASLAACGGQIVRGAGPTASDGTGAAKTILRPTSNVTVLLTVDGTPFSGWVQGFGLENLTLDMANMADAAGSVGVLQAQAFDCAYRRVRIINDGVNKRGFKFVTGAYVTHLDTCQSQWIEAIGATTSNGVTTLQIDNHDGNNVNLNFTNSVKIRGGAFQGSGTRFKIRNGADFQIETDIEGTGTAYDVDSSVNALYLRNELQGFSGATYMAGSPANSLINLDQQTNYNTYPFNLTWGYFNHNNQGLAGNSSLLSGSATSQYYLEIGRTGIDLMLGVAAATNGLVSGTGAGDVVVGSWGASTNLFLIAAQTLAAKATPTGFNTYGTGSAQFGTLVVQPAADTVALTVKTHAGVLHFDVNTSTAITSFNNGILAIGYSDAGATQTFILRANTGAIQAGAAVYPGAPAASPVVQTAGGLWAGIGAPNNTYGANGDFYFRSDTPGTANQRIYVRNAGAWTGII